MPTKPSAGNTFGGWRLEERLGRGGNGEVWLARDSNSKEAAIKLLVGIRDKNRKKAYARFKSEVSTLQTNGDIEGLLPIIDSDLPDELAGNLPWYVMPVAQPLERYLAGSSFEAAVQAILKIGTTLTHLHERGISHRDIKPANILARDGKVYLSDFGLVDYLGKGDLTSDGERLGARWTIAPEMERESHKADGKGADVYSLAKTLWILLTGRINSFEGQYDPDSINGLRHLKLREQDDEYAHPEGAPLVYLKPLDDLLRVGTDDDPLGRPSMAQFIERLGSWVHTYKDYRKRNPLQWQDVQNKLFPTAMPQRAIWEDTDAILEVLNYLGTVDNLHHMLCPDGGGMDIAGAAAGSERGTIELVILDGWVYLAKPKRLVFESFGYDWEWNYFRLETGDLESTGIGYAHRHRESVVEIAPERYISQADWERDRDGARVHPADSRYVRRYFRGAFLFVQKTSTYNAISYTYDGRHDQMETDEFRDYMHRKVELVRYIRQSSKFAELCSAKGWTPRRLIEACLEIECRQEFMERFQSGYLGEGLQDDIRSDVNED